MEKRLNFILKHMSNTIDGFASAAVVNMDDGLSIAQLSIQPEIEPDAVSAYMSSVVNTNLKAAKFLEGSHLQDDILITTDKNHFIIRYIQKTHIFIYVMIEKKNQLGKARLYLKKYEKHILETLEKKPTPLH